MSDHLTEKDMAHYVEIQTMTPENLAFISDMNTHMFQCDECKERLNAYCAQMEQENLLKMENTAREESIHNDPGSMR